MSQTSAPPPVAAPKSGAFMRLFSGLVLLLAVLAFAAVAGLALLRYLLVPNIPAYKPKIEAQVSKMLGTPVRIGELTVDWSQWNPVVDAHDVQVRNREGEVALALAEVHTQLSWRSLLGGVVVFERLDLGGPELMIKRLPDGKLQIAGLEIDPFAKSSDDSLNRWLVEQQRISIRGGILRWQDMQRNAPLATLKNAHLDLTNTGLTHALKVNGELITATDPDGKPAQLEATAKFTHPIGFSVDKADVKQWSGEVYAAMSNASLSELRRYVDIPFAIERGEGSLRGWLSIDKSLITLATADVGLEKVKAQLAKDMPWLDLERMSGRLIAKPQAIAAGGLDISAENLSWQEAGRKAIVPANISLQVVQAKLADKGKGQFTASTLDLGELQHLARYIKLPQGVNEALEKHAPRGLLSQVQASWLGMAEAPREFDFKSQLKDLSLDAVEAPPLTGPARLNPELNPGIPGFKGLSGSVHATHKSGELSLQIERGSLQLPGVMDPEVIALDKVKAQVNWQQDNAPIKDGAEIKTVPVWRLNIDATEFANAHAAGNAKAVWRQDSATVLAQQKAAASGKAAAGFLDHAHPGWLELQGKLTRGDAKSVWRYLPISIPPSVRNYLQAAVTQGSIKDAQFNINGDLYHFPFARDALDKDKPLLAGKPAVASDWRGVASQDSEVFRIALNVQDLTFDYAPASTSADGKQIAGWPGIKNMAGELVFDRVSMQIKDASGELVEFQPTDKDAIKLSKVNGRIADMRQNTTLELAGNTQGTLPDYLAFVRSTPINEWTSKVLDKTVATGDAQLDLKLTLPFSDLKTSTVEGKLALNGNDLAIVSGMPRFAAATGLVSFTEKGFAVKPMKANFLGGEATIEGGTQEDKTTAFTATGVVTAQALRSESSLGILNVIAGRATGQTPYDAKVQIRGGQPEMTVNTPLTGLALDFPAPLGKTADSTLAVKYSTQLLNTPDPTNPQNLRDLMSITIGDNIGIQYERSLKQTDKGLEQTVLRGGIGVNNPVFLPDEGVFANISMPRFDADAWGASLRRMPNAMAPAPGADASAPSTASATSDTPVSTSEMMQNPYIPKVVVLQVDELVAAKKVWNKIVAGASFKEQQWQANVDSVPFSGYLAWKPGISTGSLGKVTAKLGRLSVPKDNRDLEQLLEEPADQLPAIDMTVEEFELGGKQLGKLELDAVNVPGKLREWQLRKLIITNPESTFTANGNWLPVTSVGATSGMGLKPNVTPGKRVAMNFALEMRDSGALLTRFGIPKTIKDGAGKIEGQLSWTGSPASLDYPTLAGQISLKLQRGQFLKQDPGIARLLGVLSLQTLPRRITLDFRDVFSEGFGFDEVTAEAMVERGIARTNNFRMKGTQANVLLEGSADMARETQNLYVIVEPDVNLGTASLAYAIINPAIGLTTFFLQWIARKQVNKALAFEYQVSGSWINPKVEKLDSKSKVKSQPDNESNMPQQGLAQPAMSLTPAAQ